MRLEVAGARPRLSWSRFRALAGSIPSPWLLLGALVVARLALAGWWLIADDGVVDTESGRHLQFAWGHHAAIAGGDTFSLFGAPTEYPPLAHLVGVLGATVAGLDVESFIGAQDLVFIPALAIGCYGAASVAYGRTAGVLAAVFALGAPMAVSAFHMFLLDTAQAAMVALALWAILASERFSRTGIAALAGVAVGFGMLTKQNFPLFIFGLIVVVLARGGWRHWRGLAVFAAVAALLSAAWYWSELERTLGLVQGASASPVPATEAQAQFVRERWTLGNFGYYVWSTFNVSVLLPFTLLTLGGAATLLVRWARTRAPTDFAPELVVGGLMSYLALTWIYLKDPRYALPALPYMAVLATGWIPSIRGRPRAVAIAVVCAIALLNTVGTVADSGAPIRLSLPGASDTGLGQRQFTLYAPGGWIAGQPETEGAVLDVMRAAKADGIEAIAFDPGATQPDFNHPGLDILSRVAGIPIALPYDESDPRQALLLNHNPPIPRQPKPCAVTSDGMGVYLTKGPVPVPFEQREFYCPPAR